ncbi:MAG TPA: CHASE domain-containing protein [Plasticicumulans sp.]|nr:CHASE domain-containing protein [Plasticicumulans sp.]
MPPNLTAAALRRGRAIVLMAIAYFVLARLGLLLAIPPGYATAIWPPSGIALAGVLLYGARVAPGIWLGSFVANAVTAADLSGLPALLHSLLLPAVIGCGAMLQALFGAWLIRRWVGFPGPLQREREIIAFLLLGGPVGCLLSASIGASALVLAGVVAAHAWAFTWWNWWVGDSIGVLVVTPLVLVALGRPRRLWRRRALTVAGPLTITFAAAVLVFVWTSGREQARLQAEFDARAAALASALSDNFDDYVGVLYSLRDFYAASQDVEPEEFARFAQPALQRHPGLRALSWNRVLDDGQRDAWEQAMRAGGQPGFTLTERAADGQLQPAARRSAYVAIETIVPDRGNHSAIGYDVASDPVRRAAMERARDSGQPVATSRIALVQDASAARGMLVFMPIYANDQPVETIEQRREALRGYGVGVFLIDEIVATAVRGLAPQGIELRIREAGARLLCSYRDPGPCRDDGLEPAPAARGTLLWTSEREFAGNRWRLDLVSTAEYEAAQRSLVAWAVLAGGLLFTGLLGAFLLAVSGRAAVVERLVEERTRALEAANVALAHEIAERRRYETRLQEQNVELVAASRAKDRFLASMSHELRTPLNAIIGFTGILLMKLSGPLSAEQEQQLRTVRSAADHLLALISDLLDLARIESGAAELSREPVDLAEVLAETQRTLLPLAGERGLVLALQVPDGDWTVPCNRRAFGQIVLNLAGNAIKFTPAGRIDVRLARIADGSGERIQLSVSDTGPGLDPEAQARLFRPFEQLGTPARQEGTGLGLYLSQKLAHQLGGHISCRSKPGEGCTFTLVLPTGE